jgi:hypothetical protein
MPGRLKELHFSFISNFACPAGLQLPPVLPDPASWYGYGGLIGNMNETKQVAIKRKRASGKHSRKGCGTCK